MTANQRTMADEAKRRGIAQAFLFTWDIASVELHQMFDWDSEKLDILDDKVMQDFGGTPEEAEKRINQIKVPYPKPFLPPIAWAQKIADTARATGIEIMLNFICERTKEMGMSKDDCKTLITETMNDMANAKKDFDRFCINVARDLESLHPNSSKEILRRWIK